MINLLRNSAVGYRRRGGLGPELNTTANAVSDPAGAEADAITGWTQSGLNGTGANVFQSQGVVKNVGSYAFEMDANDTPTGGARIYIDLQAAPFNFVDGEEGKTTFDIRHVGLGGGWAAVLDNQTTGVGGNVMVLVGDSDTLFQSVEYTWTHAIGFRYFVVTEFSGTVNGGVYFDNLSIKKKI